MDRLEPIGPMHGFGPGLRLKPLVRLIYSFKFVINLINSFCDKSSSNFKHVTILALLIKVCGNFSRLMNFDTEKSSLHPLLFLLENLSYSCKQYKVPKNLFFFPFYFESFRCMF